MEPCGRPQTASGSRHWSLRLLLAQHEQLAITAGIARHQGWLAPSSPGYGVAVIPLFEHPIQIVAFRLSREKRFMFLRGHFEVHVYFPALAELDLQLTLLRIVSDGSNAHG